MTGHKTFNADALDGKVAIVTGAGSRGDGIGIGRAIAIALARAGARLVLVDRDLPLVERTAEMIRAEGGTCLVQKADVSLDGDCAEIVTQAVKAFGRVDFLINNVGIRGAAGTAVEADPQEWDTGLRINVTSMMMMAKYCVPEMKKQGGGSIINMSSVAGISGGHPYLLYPTSKGAIVGMTYSMAQHHGADLIRVNCICPGLVYTPLVADAGMSEQRRKARANAALLKSEGSAWDIADATVFLVSDASRWITGQVLAVDAGLTSTTNMVPAVEA